MITIESLKNTNLIKMNLQAGEPKLAKDIANVWASLFIEKNKDLNLQESKEAQGFIEEQLKISNQNLSKIEEEIREFNETNKIETLDNEIKGKVAKTLNYDLRLADIKLSLQKEKTRKEQVIIALNEQDKVLKLSKSITEDQFFNQLMSSLTNDNFNNINLTYVSEEINPIYYDLVPQLISTDISINSLQAEEKQLKENIDDYWKRIGNLKQELAQLRKN